MFDWVKDAVVAGLAALFGGVLSSLVGYGYLSRLHKKADDNNKEIKRLRDDNIGKLEKKVEDHIKNDKSQQILTEMKNVVGEVSKLGDKMDAVREDSAGQDARISANAKFIDNIDESFQKHKNGKH
jgi:outer membrane murein-binding lipoprotein Lpp